MKVLVIGANGFLGSAVCRALEPSHEVVKASYHAEGLIPVDLLDPSSIRTLLEEVKPEVVINCAGILIGEDISKNPAMTENLLKTIANLKLRLKRIIIIGSAAEYGEVQPPDLPVKETQPIKPIAEYGKSKAEEVAIALKYAKEFKLPVTITRLFNAVGPGMNARLLIPGISRQLKDGADPVVVTRLDAARDYIDVQDVARAIKLIVEGQPKHDVYNIGSGTTLLASDIYDLMLKASKLKTRPMVEEADKQPEPPIASQADSSRIHDEFGWQPQVTIEQSVKDIINA